MFGLRSRNHTATSDREELRPDPIGAAPGDPQAAAAYPADPSLDSDHEIHVTGEICGRCQRTLDARDEVRRSGAGGWVHISC